MADPHQGSVARGPWADGHIGDLQAQLEELEREVEQKEAYVAELRATKEALEQQAWDRPLPCSVLWRFAPHISAMPIFFRGSAHG